jgi:integrase
MAQWVRRSRTDGGESIQIKWKVDGRYQSETFTDARLAAEFRTAVELAGHRWPEGWVRGEGWTGRDRVAEPGSAVPPEPEPVVTVADVANGPDGYFVHQRRRVLRGKVKLYTVFRAERAFALHLEPAFGRSAFVAVGPEAISDWVDEQLEFGAAPKSIRHRHGLLSSVMKHGQVRLKLRPDNPCALTELPELTTGTSAARQVRFFQHGEWALFRSCLAQDMWLLHDLELSTGMRWGEVSALRVADVTFAGEGVEFQANIHVVRAWSQRAPGDTCPVRWDEGENLSWVLGPPKSRRPRWVVVTGDVAQRLKAAVAGRAGREFVFVTRYGNPWRYPDYHSDRWVPARRLAQQRGLTRSVAPHMLRHTCVVWSLAEGVPIQVVSEMIGHTSLQMTYDVYGGLVNLHDPVMAQAMARALLVAGEAIQPRFEPATVRVLRPGRRGQARRRAS